MAKHGNKLQSLEQLLPASSPFCALQGAIHLWPAGGDSHRQGQNFRNFNERSWHWKDGCWHFWNKKMKMDWSLQFFFVYFHPYLANWSNLTTIVSAHLKPQTKRRRVMLGEFGIGRCISLPHWFLHIHRFVEIGRMASFWRSKMSGKKKWQMGKYFFSSKKTIASSSSVKHLQRCVPFILAAIGFRHGGNNCRMMWPLQPSGVFVAPFSCTRPDALEMFKFRWRDEGWFWNTLDEQFSKGTSQQCRLHWNKLLWLTTM